jgi:hypothetical protein
VRSVGSGEWGDTLDLIEELRLGSVDGPPEELFGRVSALAVGPDETLFVTDLHGPTVRSWSAEGRFLGRLGGEGRGPGEYVEPDAGLSVLSDGRLLLRDPPNGRINVYSTSGDVLTHWRHPGIRTSTPLFVDESDHMYNLVIASWHQDPGARVFGLARIDREGEVVDTIIPPGANYRNPMVTARRGDQSNSVPIPFTPRYHWTLDRAGHFVQGLSDEYRIMLEYAGRPLVIERPSHRRAPVAPGEADAERRSVRTNLRNTDPSWDWTGPDIPDEKPPFRRLLSGRHGRVWVVVHQPARRVVDVETTEAGERRAERWVEPLVFDVFEPDGTYLGAVRGPERGISFWASPVMDGDRVWAVTWDDLEVPYVVRYRIG